jgi:GxxExxY protein
MCEEDRIAREVVDAALKLHKHFGPGVFEAVYEPVLIHELKKRNFTIRNQIPVPVVYEGITSCRQQPLFLNLGVFASWREIFFFLWGLA